MPNQYVSADGKLIAQVLNTAVSIGGEADGSGRAIVIHGGADNYESQPSGDAAERTVRSSSNAFDPVGSRYAARPGIFRIPNGPAL
ncbi:superoxide dismutase family protein [Roseovarius sp.]|uniref:superoxide dismutase family protein n=1 Tax=Roseovarius sp. TaxID=1486281 RepID=UPI003D0F1F7D